MKLHRRRPARRRRAPDRRRRSDRVPDRGRRDGARAWSCAATRASSGKPGSTGPQAMRAQDIDLAYAEDGRTLQSAKLIENASVQLPGETGQAGTPDRRQDDRHRDGARRRDGDQSCRRTRTSQVDLPGRRRDPGAAHPVGVAAWPPARPAPASRRRPSTGNVDFKETRAAQRQAGRDRSARARSRAHGRADQARLRRSRAAPTFHGNVHFTDGPQTTADAPTAVYADRQGSVSICSPGRATRAACRTSRTAAISVDAAHIQMGLGNQKLKADTNVQSVMMPQSGKPRARAARKRRRPRPARRRRPTRADRRATMPSMLEAGRAGQRAVEPARLRRRELAGDLQRQRHALSQTDTDDPGRHDRRSTTRPAICTRRPTCEHDDPDRGRRQDGDGRQAPTPEGRRRRDAPRRPRPSRRHQADVTVADELLYDDAKHQATYTGNAHMSGPDGDVTADKIELFLAEQGGRARARRGRRQRRRRASETAARTAST